jgi:hypothetical protein
LQGELHFYFLNAKITKKTIQIGSFTKNVRKVKLNVCGDNAIVAFKVSLYLKQDPQS